MKLMGLICFRSVVLLFPNVYVLDFLFCNTVHVHFVFVVWVKYGVSERSVCSVEGGMCFPGAGSMWSICESGDLPWENHGMCLYVKQIDRCY